MTNPMACDCEVCLTASASQQRSADAYTRGKRDGMAEARALDAEPEYLAQQVSEAYELGKKAGAKELAEWAVRIDLPWSVCPNADPHGPHTWVSGAWAEEHLGWQCHGRTGMGVER